MVLAVDHSPSQSDPNADEHSWLLADHQGSVHQVVDDSGAVEVDTRYDSYGVITSLDSPATLDTIVGYTGQVYDVESGLHYFNARYYDAPSGRFLSEDPIGFAGGDANLYRYVGNNPVNMTDPTGLKAQ